MLYIQLNAWTYTVSFGIAQVTPYAHGTSDLLGIQIDAAINPGLSFASALKKPNYFAICYMTDVQSIDLSSSLPEFLKWWADLLFWPFFCSGNSGGPAFNDQGECIGVAFQVLLLSHITGTWTCDLWFWT